MNETKWFATPEALPMMFERNRREPELERYYSPNETEGVACTTSEREAFEQDNAIALTSDVVPDQGDFDSLVRYLAEYCDLEEVGR